jgi:hypothetical protein
LLGILDLQVQNTQQKFTAGCGCASHNGLGGGVSLYAPAYIRTPADFLIQVIFFVHFVTSLVY